VVVTLLKGQYSEVLLPEFNDMEVFDIFSRPDYDRVESNLYYRFGCQNLQNIVGIYFLFNDDELIYIGEGVISHRVLNHLSDGKEMNKFLFFGVNSIKERKYIEDLLIKEFKPKYNNL
jgi:hypothetical protein